MENVGAERLQSIKEALFKDLEGHKRADGIHFVKSVLFATGSK
jgi:hypothetical protein